MLKSAILAAATVLAISTGAFGVSSASADPRRIEHRAERWHGDARSAERYVRRPYERHVHRPARICRPIMRTVRVHGHHGWHFKRIVVGERCHFVRRGW